MDFCYGQQCSTSIVLWSVCIIYIHPLITHMKKQKLQEVKRKN